MDILTCLQVRELDRFAIQEYGIPSVQLMKQAAGCVKERIDEWDALHKHILIVCGPGNNGGDGFSLAVQLVDASYEQVEILCDVDPQKMSQDELYYANMAKQAGIYCYRGLSYEEKTRLIQQCDFIVDALFGTGLTRELSGEYVQLIDLINASQATILSVDMPSGIHGDSGKAMGTAICAQETMTFACLKQGLLLQEGRKCAGKIQVCDIGIPYEAYEEVKRIQVMDDELAHTFLPKRKRYSHKGSYGKVLLIGGSSAMHGAITLTAQSMLRSGVGTLTLFLPHDIVPILSLKCMECMVIDAPSDQGYFAKEATDLLKECLNNYDLLVIGNGMGRNDASEQLVRTVLESDLPSIIDGDGLYACGHQMELLKKRKATTIVTPHPKEMSYLTGKSVAEILQDPFQIAQEFIDEVPQSILVLKNQMTLIQSNQKAYMNLAGNNSLAKGGSGDVLCGIIAGLFAQGKNALENASCGVYVHAKCSDFLLQKEDANSILPSDLILTLSNIYKSLR